MFIVMFIRNNKVEQYDVAKERADAATLGKNMVVNEYQTDYDLVYSMLEETGYYHWSGCSVQIIKLIAL